MNKNIQTKFSIGYYKYKSLDLQCLEQNYNDCIDSDKYNPFKIEKLQNYNPIYNSLFTLSNKNYNTIQLNQPYHFINMETISLNEQELKKDVFIKYAPLLDPLHYMVGKYEDDRNLLCNLPYPDNISIDMSYNVLHKIKTRNNCSYVDSFFCYLSSMTLHNHNIVNCLDFYDSFLGIQSNYKYDVTDDIDYLTSSTFFNDNIGTLYTLENVDMDLYNDNESRKKRSKLCISKSNHNISAISITECLTDVPDITNENLNDCVLYDNQLDVKNNDDDVNDDSSTSDDSSLAYTTESDSDNDKWETDDSDSDSSEECSTIQDDQYAFIKDFPVQLICLEKCDGTFDDLFTSGDITLQNSASALFQIVMTLIIYQKMFDFTHNDLHTNNIMYINTDIPFLFYKFENITYKVPTYGKIYKIIDFGRSIYKFNGKRYCSDSFGPGGDADTQYNCEPFFNKNKARLEPNMSFDLCRLGCSIYDFIIPGHLQYDDYDELQKTIYRWCLDDNKKNVLYKKNGEERYPEFKLYKMIARTVHKHTPQGQLEFPFFYQFVYNDESDAMGDNLIDINSIPVYI
jgi:hypothetical protein